MHLKNKVKKRSFISPVTFKEGVLIGAKAINVEWAQKVDEQKEAGVGPC
jgi:hypothetical protein